MVWMRLEDASLLRLDMCGCWVPVVAVLITVVVGDGKSGAVAVAESQPSCKLAVLPSLGNPSEDDLLLGCEILLIP
jgi:hypothetical protein